MRFKVNFTVWKRNHTFTLKSKIGQTYINGTTLSSVKIANGFGSFGRLIA